MFFVEVAELRGVDTVGFDVMSFEGVAGIVTAVARSLSPALGVAPFRGRARIAFARA